MLPHHPQLLSSVGTVSYKFHRKGSSPWWGLWVPGHEPVMTLCDPIDGSPPGSAEPGILQARTLECVAISFSNAGK